VRGGGRRQPEGFCIYLGQVTDSGVRGLCLTARTEHSHHVAVAGTNWRYVLGNGLHAVWHGRVVLAHDALAVAGVHVGHLDTTGAVAASAVGTTHKQLTGLLRLEQTLAG